MARVSDDAKARKSEYDRAYHLANRAKKIAAAKAWYEAHPERKHEYDRARRNGEQREAILADKRTWHHENKDTILPRHRKYHLKAAYGITLEDKAAMLWAQGGACAICRGELTIDDRNAHVDHDHKTGAIRGILCHGCNMGLGSFRDDPERLRAAIEYLRTAAAVPNRRG